MKYLIVIVLVLALIWFVRNNRRGADRRDDKPPPALGDPQDMVRCPVCSVHLPRIDALPGGDGKLYCCADHRARSGN
jgi:uncharacterized protein